MVGCYDPDHPDVGFQQQWVAAGQVWDLGSFAPGESQTLNFRRPRLNEPGGPVLAHNGRDVAAAS